MSTNTTDDLIVGRLENIIAEFSLAKRDYVSKAALRNWLNSVDNGETNGLANFIPVIAAMAAVGAPRPSLKIIAAEADKMRDMVITAGNREYEQTLIDEANSAKSAPESQQPLPEEGPKQLELADMSASLNEFLDAYVSMRNEGTVERNPELDQLLIQRGWVSGDSGRWYSPDVASDLGLNGKKESVSCCPPIAAVREAYGKMSSAPQTQTSGGGSGLPPLPPLDTAYAEPGDPKEGPKGPFGSMLDRLQEGFDKALAGATPISRSASGGAPIINAAVSVAVQFIAP